MSHWEEVATFGGLCEISDKGVARGGPTFGGLSEISDKVNQIVTYVRSQINISDKVNRVVAYVRSQINISDKVNRVVVYVRSQINISDKVNQVVAYLRSQINIFARIITPSPYCNFIRPPLKSKLVSLILVFSEGNGVKVYRERQKKRYQSLGGLSPNSDGYVSSPSDMVWASEPRL